MSDVFGFLRLLGDFFVFAGVLFGESAFFIVSGDIIGKKE